MSDLFLPPMITLNIQPIEKTITRTYNTIDIIDVNVKLYEGATIKVLLRGNQDFETQTLNMNKDDYLKWMNCDDYIKEWVINQLNVIPV